MTVVVMPAASEQAMGGERRCQNDGDETAKHYETLRARAPGRYRRRLRLSITHWQTVTQQHVDCDARVNGLCTLSNLIFARVNLALQIHSIGPTRSSYCLHEKRCSPSDHFWPSPPANLTPFSKSGYDGRRSTIPITCTAARRLRRSRSG